MSGKKLLDNVAEEIKVCVKCRLSKMRKKAIPGEGNPKSRVMFIGEGPGRMEDVEGRPFVGQAGKFLNTLLSEAGLSREDVFICNIVRCRPPSNRDPLPDEVQACASYLDRQMKAIRPNLIVTLGKHSTSHVFSQTTLPFSNITRIHGKLYGTTLLGMKVTIFPSFHPAAGLYNGEYKNQLVEDFHLLGKELASRMLDRHSPTSLRNPK